MAGLLVRAAQVVRLKRWDAVPFFDQTGVPGELIEAAGPLVQATAAATRQASSSHLDAEKGAFKP